MVIDGETGRIRICLGLWSSHSAPYVLYLTSNGRTRLLRVRCWSPANPRHQSHALCNSTSPGCSCEDDGWQRNSKEITLPWAERTTVNKSSPGGQRKLSKATSMCPEMVGMVASCLGTVDKSMGRGGSHHSWGLEGSGGWVVCAYALVCLCAHVCSQMCVHARVYGSVGI